MNLSNEFFRITKTMIPFTVSCRLNSIRLMNKLGMDNMLKSVFTLKEDGNDRETYERTRSSDP